MNNNIFTTEDINLAAFLISKQVKLIEVEALSSRHSRFLLEQPPQRLLNDWLTGAANSNADRVINCYRHLVRDAKTAQEKLRGGGQ